MSIMDWLVPGLRPKAELPQVEAQDTLPSFPEELPPPAFPHPAEFPSKLYDGYWEIFEQTPSILLCRVYRRSNGEIVLSTIQERPLAGELIRKTMETLRKGDE